MKRVVVTGMAGVTSLGSDWDTIAGRLRELAATGGQGWLEVVYEGDEILGDLRERLEAAIADTGMEILRIKNSRIIDSVLGQMHAEETLDDLDVHDVFARRLALENLPEEQRQELLHAYRETLSSLHDDDLQAE